VNEIFSWDNGQATENKRVFQRVGSRLSSKLLKGSAGTYLKTELQRGQKSERAHRQSGSTRGWPVFMSEVNRLAQRMRRRLQKFLPVVLLALAMQVLAPIAACWAAGVALADPLQGQAICHSSDGALPGGQTDPTAHGSGCSICCLAQASATLAAPPSAFQTPFRPAERIFWQQTTKHIALAHYHSNAQARAPPRVS
jgi:hypothetical protein